MGKVKWLELWWQLYVTSLPQRDVWTIRPLDFCWTVCTTPFTLDLSTRLRCHLPIPATTLPSGKLPLTCTKQEAVYVHFEENKNHLSPQRTASWLPNCPSQCLVTTPSLTTSSHFPKHTESNCQSTNSPQEDHLLLSVQTAVSEPQHYQRNRHRSAARYVPTIWERAPRHNTHCKWNKC